MKWTNSYGPRKVKPIEQLLKDVSAAARTRKDITGVHGKPETQHTSCFLEIFGNSRADVAEKLTGLGNKYGWVINEANASALTADLTALLAWAKETMPLDDQRISQEEDAANKARTEEHNRQAREEDAKRMSMEAAIMAKKPAGASALILAEYEEDACEPVSNYYGSKTIKVVAIGWRFGSREDFQQLHKVAGQYEPTAHLGPNADKDIEKACEHRENYSMGGGNYLKAGGRYSTGWQVYSCGLSRYLPRIDEIAFPENVQASTAIAEPVDGMTISENEQHDGIEIRFPAKPDPAVLDKLKANGWRWSRFSHCWYRKRTPESRALAESLQATA